MKNISIIGSTGSIGTQCLQIIDQHPDKFSVVALTCGSQVQLVAEQVRKYRPELVAAYHPQEAKKLKDLLKDEPITVLSGMEGLIAAATLSSADIVVTSVVGNIGLRPTVAAIKAGKDIALANKETLVTAGELIMPLAKEMGVQILPVDSEHNAIFQCLEGYAHSTVEKIILTASGGPFRGKNKNDLVHVLAKDALKHPNWDMGRKISIDSATLMNKGLEAIEAKWLFNVRPDQIDVIVHPQSIVHSMVEYRDGSVLAQMGVPDMRLPILYALTYPDRLTLDMERLDFTKLSDLRFEAPDRETFPCLDLAFAAMEAGGTLPTVLNAANEILVMDYLNDQIGFYDIPRRIEEAMANHTNILNPSFEDIHQVDAYTRQWVEQLKK